MKKDDEQIKLRKYVYGVLSDPVVRELYPFFAEWERTAYDQGVKAQRKYSMGELKGKLAEEYLEALRNLKEYFRVRKPENRGKYAEKVLEEVGDMANMALIICPQFVDNGSEWDNGHVPLERMIMSMHFRSPDFRRRPVFPYDSSRRHSQRYLFGIWLREIEAINQCHRQIFAEPQEKRNNLLQRVEMNVEAELEGIDKHLELEHQQFGAIIYPHSSLIVSLGNCVTNSMFMLSELDVLGDPSELYRGFFITATEKMKRRNERYHPIERNDEMK